jgi:hypothetical protein
MEIEPLVSIVLDEECAVSSALHTLHQSATLTCEGDPVIPQKWGIYGGYGRKEGTA